MNLLVANPANAIVPADAPIQPPQAYVDYVGMVTLILYVGSGFNLSGVGLTEFLPDEIMSDVSFVPAWTNGTYLLDNNALTNSTVDSILASCATYTATGVIDLSGTDMGVPTPVQSRINGTWTITITGTPVGSISLEDAFANIAAPVFGVDVDVSSGVPATIATNLADYIDGRGNTGWDAVAASNVVTVTVTADASLPLVAGTDSATNLTIADVAGQSFIANSDIVTCVGNGAQVTVMEYVNRSGSGDKESVTYT